MASRLLAPRMFRAPALALTQRTAAAAAASPISKRLSSTVVNVKDPLLVEQEHAKEHAAKSADFWRKVTYYICIPGSIVMGVWIYQIETGHLQHRDHEIAENGGELPEEGKPKYEYQNIRRKPFPWGMQSFFFNPKANYPAEL